MENPLKSIYDSIENYILKSATFKKLATTFYERGGGNGSKRIPYERQGADMRTKEIKDWQTAVMAATDPKNPRRELLYFIYQSLLRDDDLQATIENRVLPLQMASFRMVDKKTGEHVKEATELLERTWFQDLRRMSIMSTLQGNLLVSLAEKLNPKTLEIEEIEEIPQCNYVAQAGVIVENPYDQIGTSYREGGMETYYYQFGKDWDLGLLNVLAIPIFAKKLGFGSWISYIDQFGIPFMFVVTERLDEKRRDELFDMMNEMRSGRYAVLQGQERIDFGKEASSSTTNAFEPFMERCHGIITRLILGQTGTTNNEAFEGTSEVHERVEKYRHEADKLRFMYLFNYEIIPRLVKISPAYAIFERCKLEWDNHETLTLKEYIDAIKNLAYTFDFDPEKVAEMTGLPITALKEVTNQGIQSGGNRKDNGKNGNNGTKPNPDDDDDPDDDDPNGKGTGKKKEETKAESLIPEIDMLYYDGEEMPEAAVSFPLLQKVRERILKRFRSEEFNYRKDIDPDLFGHTFETLDKGLRDTFGTPAWGTPDRDFLEYASKNLAVFSGFKTLQQQKELHNLLFDKNGNMKSFDQFRKDTAKVLDKYNQNWLRTEYNTLVARARFASDWKKFERDKDLYPNLKWLPSSSIDKRDGHKLFYNRVWPIDDPFWNTNYPGNLWNCKCGIKSTSEGAAPAKRHNHSKPSPGLDENPGKTGVMFSKEHPYIKNATKRDRKVVEEFTGPIVTEDVEDLKDLQNVIDKYIERYPEDFNGKKITVKWFSDKPNKATGYTPMKTENGTISINDVPIYQGEKSPKQLLISAFKKMPKRQKNEFSEENALKNFYHEILHIRAKGRSNLLHEGLGDYKRFAMETINELVAQNEYPQFINRLGGRVSFAGNGKMKEMTSTYKARMNRLRELFSAGNVKEKEAYDFLVPKLMTEKYENLDNVLYEYLKKKLSFKESMDDFYELMQNGSMTKWNDFIKSIKK